MDLPAEESVPIEQILDDHADWLLRYWYRDYDMWSPYFAHLPELLVANYKDAHTYVEPSYPAVGSAEHEHITIYGTHVKVLPKDNEKHKGGFYFYFNALLTAVKAIFRPLCPAWTVDGIFAAVRQAADNIGDPFVYEKFLEAVDAESQGDERADRVALLERESEAFRDRHKM